MDKSLYRVIPFIYYSSFRLMVKNSKPLGICLLLTLLKTVKRWMLFKIQYPNLNTVFYYEPSINNRKSLKTTKDELDPAIIESCDKPYGYFPDAWIYLYSFLSIGKFLSFYKKQSQEDRDLIRFFFGEIFLSAGYYRVIDNCFKKNPQLKVIVMANDHVPSAMCLKLLASKYNVKTIYTQHASVTDNFPSLQFDYAFLDGIESYEKYKKVGNMSGKVYIAGSPRFDEIYRNFSKSEILRIGVALNSLDNLDKVKQLCFFLIDKNYNKILLRPHPCMEKACKWTEYLKKGIEISFPSKESSFKYLEKCSYLISNESSIHLDAAMVNVPSLLYNFSDNPIQDWYGYHNKGLMPIANSLSEVLTILKEGRTVDSKLVKYYNASHGSTIEGEVGHIVGKYINELVNSGNTSELDERYFKFTENKYYIVQ